MTAGVHTSFESSCEALEGTVVECKNEMPQIEIRAIRERDLVLLFEFIGPGWAEDFVAGIVAQTTTG